VRDRFLVDEIYDATVVRGVFAAADVSARRIDPVVIDGAVNGAGARGRGGERRVAASADRQRPALRALVPRGRARAARLLGRALMGRS
jgi:hypothetical protein